LDSCEVEPPKGLIRIKVIVAVTVIYMIEKKMVEHPTNKKSFWCNILGIHLWCRGENKAGQYIRYCLRCGKEYEINREMDWNLVH